MAERRRKHWGWGYEDEQPGPDELRATAAGLADHLGFGEREPEPPVALDDVELAPPRLETPYAQDPWSRAAHAPGPLLPRRRARAARRVPAPARRRRLPGLGGRAARACSTGAGSATSRWCRSAAARAWSAASTRSRARPRRRRRGQPARARPRARGRPVSRAARIQAGATGPGLEAQLAEHGLTMRFYPQSFELSTLGGWIATRAGGHFATGPTHVDDLVESVRALTADGRGVGVAAAAGLGRRARRPTACCSARRARSR